MRDSGDAPLRLRDVVPGERQAGAATASRAEVCSFHSAMAASARSTICCRRTALSRTGECDVSSIRPNVTFIGSNVFVAGRSELAPSEKDRRFTEEAWARNPLFKRTLQGYLAFGQAVAAFVTLKEGRTPSDALVGPIAVASIRSLHYDAVIMGVLGGLLPAVKAARLPIATALRQL